MKHTIIAASLLATSICFTPAAAVAQDSGFSLGLRAGYAVPFGEASGGTDLSDLATGAVPLQVDADYRVSRDWRLGIYFGYGPAFVADAAERDLEAAGLTDVGGHRQQVLGVQVTRVFKSGARFSPRVGLAGGYEWTRYAGAKRPSGMETEVGLSGFAGSVTLGGDYAVSPRFAVGPYVSVDLGRYRKELVWVEDADTSFTDIRDKALHGWVEAGVRLTWTF
ncbi:MAG: hypothetical protein R6V57_04115 [Vicinamibacterales bacterium]